MQEKLTLVVLAAGMGTRYGGLKQLVPIGPSGEALFEYSIYDALRADCDRVVLVVREETETEFRHHAEKGLARALASRNVPLRYAHQRPDDLPTGFSLPESRTKPWGTAHAVLSAAPDIRGPFVVLNADDFYGAAAFEATSRFVQSSAATSGAVVGFEVGQTLSDSGPVSRALCATDAQGCLCEIVELHEIWRQKGQIVYRDAAGDEQHLEGRELVSMNMWSLPAEVLPELRRRFRSFLRDSAEVEGSEFLLPDVIQDLVKQGLRVEVLHGPGPWCGLTYAEDQQKASALVADLVRQGIYPENLWR